MKLTKLVVMITLMLAGALFSAATANADSIGCRPSISSPGTGPLCHPVGDVSR